MNKNSRFTLLLVGAALGLTLTEAQAVLIPVDFSASQNYRMQNLQPLANQYPEGSVILGGIPFNIPVGGNNMWLANASSTSITVPVGIYGVDAVHTLINTSWGQPGPNSYTAVEFIGTGGLDFTYHLIGNVDIRDHLFGFWTNNINNTTTVNVFTSTGGRGSQVRLDKQVFDLPSAFLTETLTSIRFIDTGADSFSRMMVEGITVDAAEQVPDSSIAGWLLALGVAPLLLWHRRARSLPTAT